jgi:hypothetical protein
LNWRCNWYFICDEDGKPQRFNGKIDFMEEGKTYGYLCDVRRADAENEVIRGFDMVLFRLKDFNISSSNYIEGKFESYFGIVLSFSGMEATKKMRGK